MKTTRDVGDPMVRAVLEDLVTARGATHEGATVALLAIIADRLTALNKHLADIGDAIDAAGAP